MNNWIYGLLTVFFVPLTFGFYGYVMSEHASNNILKRRIRNQYIEKYAIVILPTTFAGWLALFISYATTDTFASTRGISAVIATIILLSNTLLNLYVFHSAVIEYRQIRREHLCRMLDWERQRRIKRSTPVDPL